MLESAWAPPANAPKGIEGGASMYEQTRAVFTKSRHLEERGEAS